LGESVPRSNGSGDSIKLSDCGFLGESGVVEKFGLFGYALCVGG
jgi:hypothetical protein